jgi:hypothetical protein
MTRSVVKILPIVMSFFSFLHYVNSIFFPFQFFLIYLNNILFYFLKFIFHINILKYLKI